MRFKVILSIPLLRATLSKFDNNKISYFDQEEDNLDCAGLSVKFLQHVIF